MFRLGSMSRILTKESIQNGERRKKNSFNNSGINTIHSRKARKTISGLNHLHYPSVIRLREYTRIDWGKNRKPSHSHSKHKCTFIDIDFTVLSNHIIRSILLTELTYIAKMIMSIRKPLRVNVTNTG